MEGRIKNWEREHGLLICRRVLTSGSRGDVPLDGASAFASSKRLAGLSVVLPLYNCRHLIESHLDSMENWIDLASEIIVIYSHSTDETLECLRARLKHPGLRIIERNRGLYESWNEGIAATREKWVYISTVGDAIERHQLLRLINLGERSGSDVVVSAPRFVDEDGKPHKDLGWPPSALLSEFGKTGAILFNPEMTQYLAFRHCPQALLGSSASNLYRGAHLRSRPFPTEYGRVGDTAWIMRFADETRMCLTASVGSTYCVHRDAQTLTPAECVQLKERMIMEERCRLDACARTGSLLREHFPSELPEQAVRSRELWLRKHDLWHAPERRFLNRARWLGVTWRYLLWRGFEKVAAAVVRIRMSRDIRWVEHLDVDDAP